MPGDAPTDPVRLGEHARSLLDDPVLRLALERIEAKAATGFLNTTPMDAEKREGFYRLNWAARQFRAELHAMLGDAKVVQAEQRAADEVDARRR